MSSTYIRQDRLLVAIGEQESRSLGDVCRSLEDDCPRPGDGKAWAMLFGLIKKSCKEGFVLVEYRAGRVAYLQLTEAGAARVREVVTGRPEPVIEVEL